MASMSGESATLYLCRPKWRSRTHPFFLNPRAFWVAQRTQRRVPNILIPRLFSLPAPSPTDYKPRFYLRGWGGVVGWVGKEPGNENGVGRGSWTRDFRQSCLVSKIPRCLPPYWVTGAFGALDLHDLGLPETPSWCASEIVEVINISLLISLVPLPSSSGRLCSPFDSWSVGYFIVYSFGVVVCFVSSLVFPWNSSLSCRPTMIDATLHFLFVCLIPPWYALYRWRFTQPVVKPRISNFPILLSYLRSKCGALIAPNLRNRSTVCTQRAEPLFTALFSDSPGWAGNPTIHQQLTRIFDVTTVLW